MTDTASRLSPPLETQLEAAREWKRIGMALAMGAAALETLLLSEMQARAALEESK